MIFDLAKDFHDAAASMPGEHPKHEMIDLLRKAVRSDVHFLDSHPTTLFQCMWNLCWWHDCPVKRADLPGRHERAYQVSEASIQAAVVQAFRRPAPDPAAQSELERLRLLFQQSPPRIELGPDLVVARLSEFMEEWKDRESAAGTLRPWVRSRRPPRVGLGAHQLAVLRTDEGGIGDVVVSPNGGIIASVDSGNTVRLWDPETGAILRVLGKLTQRAVGLAFSSDGSCLVVACRDGTVRIWSVEGGHALREFVSAHADPTSMALSPCGRLIVLGHFDGTVIVRDRQTFDEVRVLLGHQSHVRCVCWSPDGRWIATAGGGDLDKTVRFWDAATGQARHVLTGMRDPMKRVTFSPDSRRLLGVGGFEAGQVGLWDVETGESVGALRADEHVVWDACFSPDGHRIATGGYDGSVRLWNSHTGEIEAVFTGHHNRVDCLAFSPDGRWLASSSRDSTRLWDPSGSHVSMAGGGQRRDEPIDHAEGVASLLFSGDGKRLATGGANADVAMWDAESGRNLWILHPPDALIPTEEERDGQPLSGVVLGESSVRVAAFSPDRTFLVTLTERSARLWEAETGRIAWSIASRRSWGRLAAFSPDGSLLALECSGGALAVVDCRRGAILAECPWFECKLRSLAFSGDGAAIVAASDRHVGAWEADGRILWTVGNLSPALRSVSLSPDGRAVIGAFENGTRRAWDARTGRVLQAGGVGRGVDSPQDRDAFRVLPMPEGPSGESVIAAGASGEVAAWYNADLVGACRSPVGPVWAGASGADFFFTTLARLCIVSLEGIESGRPGNERTV